MTSESNPQTMPFLVNPSAPTGRWGKWMGRVRKNWLLYILLLPSIVSALIFYYYPVASGFFHSFTYWDIKHTVWIGLENYQRILEDPISFPAWRNMLILLISNLVIVVTTPLLGATLVAHLRSDRAKFWWRITFVLPIVVPATVTVFVWRWFYGLDGGFNQILRLMGQGNLAHLWLGDRATALWAIVLVGFPWIAGLSFLIYLAALQSIPTEILDAARVDGASSLQRFFQVELPYIRNQILVVIVLTFIFYIRSFDAPLIMTNGGPGQTGTVVPGLQMYRAVRDDLDLGYGSAIGMVLFLATLVLTLVNIRLSRRQD